MDNETFSRQPEPILWAPVPGWENYKVCNDGRILQIDKLRLLYPAGKLLHVWLIGDGTYWKTSPGVIVLTTFVCPRPIGLECCHEDDNRLNNNLYNIRWDTSKGNMRDRLRNGLQPIGECHFMALLSDEKVLEMRHLRSIDPKTWTWHALAARYEVSSICVRRAVAGVTWKHLPLPMKRAI